MSLEEELFDCLKTINGGIYPMLAPQNKELPYSTYDVVSDIKTTALAGQCDLPQIRFQINTYADDLVEGVAIKEELQLRLLACDKFKTIIYQSFNNMTDNGHTYHLIIDFKLIRK